MVGQDELSYVTGLVEQIDPRGQGDKTYLSYQVEGLTLCGLAQRSPPRDQCRVPCRFRGGSGVHHHNTSTWGENPDIPQCH